MFELVLFLLRQISDCLWFIFVIGFFLKGKLYSNGNLKCRSCIRWVLQWRTMQILHQVGATRRTRIMLYLYAAFLLFLLIFWETDEDLTNSFTVLISKKLHTAVGKYQKTSSKVSCKLSRLWLKGLLSLPL